MDSKFAKTLIASIVLGLAGMSGASNAAQQNKAHNAVPAKSGTNIFGTAELPKGLVIVPWKKVAPRGELDASPTRLIGAPLTPIDPEVFRHRLRFYKQSIQH